MGHGLPAMRVWDDVLSREKMFSRGPEYMDVAATEALDLLCGHVQFSPGIASRSPQRESWLEHAGILVLE